MAAGATRCVSKGRAIAFAGTGDADSSEMRAVCSETETRPRANGLLLRREAEEANVAEIHPFAWPRRRSAAELLDPN